MRILVISDTHGQIDALYEILEREQEFQILIHCGDVEYQADEIRQLVKDCPCYIVAGNNDWGRDLRDELILNLDDYRVMICHGHQYRISLGEDWLIEEAQSRNAKIVFCGHTHRPMVLQKGNLLLLNPGSLSYPRQAGRKPSYIVLEIDKDHELHYEVKYLD